MLGLLSLPKLTSSSGDEWMTSSRVGHSLTDGGHVLQDMKEAMKVACQKAYLQNRLSELLKKRQLDYFLFGTLQLAHAPVQNPLGVPRK